MNALLTKVRIEALPTGVRGLDAVLGGGFPEYSFNLIVGGPGAGKTTLVHQIAFSLAAQGRKVLLVTLLGEPALKMLRYQQQYAFFDNAVVDEGLRFVSLSEEAAQGDLGAVVARLEREVEAMSPCLVIIDSFRALLPRELSLDTVVQSFVQHLVVSLAAAQTTALLVGEYSDEELDNNPVFANVDGILWLGQAVERSAVVRKLRVVKMRGQAPVPGLHTFRITAAGLEVFPRMTISRDSPLVARAVSRVPSGVPGLDAMLGGGFLAGDSILVAGPAGTGKTILSTEFIAEGVRRGEAGVIAVFEEHPDRYLDRARHVGVDLAPMIEAGKLRILYLRPIDLSVDETLHAINALVADVSAQRVVIDSLSGFELAVAPSFREDFRESLYQMTGTLTTLGITVMMTVEVIESFTDLRFSPYDISFLVDDVIFQRYVELDGRLARLLAVVKMRGTEHDTALRRYRIDAQGIHVGERFEGYTGILTGVPTKVPPARPPCPGLVDRERLVLRRLRRLPGASLAELGDVSGLDRRALERALERLVELAYASRAQKAGRVTYRATSVPKDG